MDGIRHFWREICLELPTNGARRHALAEYSQLEFLCDSALSSFYTVLRYRLDHDLMNLGSVRPPAGNSSSSTSASEIDVVGSSSSSSSATNDGVHPAPPRRRIRVAPGPIRDPGPARPEDSDSDSAHSSHPGEA
jgi:hypothetical protein